MEHGTAPGDTTGPGHGNPRCLFSSLLVLPVACRGLGARRQSLLSGLSPLRSLVVCFISSFTVLARRRTTRSCYRWESGSQSFSFVASSQDVKSSPKSRSPPRLLPRGPRAGPPRAHHTVGMGDLRGLFTIDSLCPHRRASLPVGVIL